MIHKSKKKGDSFIFGLILRYLIILLLGLGGLWLIYTVLRPLTYYVVFGISSLFTNVLGNPTDMFLLFDNFGVELVDACVAGAAFYLLLILNLTTPMSADKRRKTLIFSIVALFTINSLRILFLIYLASLSLVFFNATHIFFWYVLSVVFVAGIWIWVVKRYSISQIPVYSDVKNLLRLRGLAKKR